MIDARESTPPTEEGPFYRPGAPFRTAIADGVEGEPLVLNGRVVSGEAGAPLAGATLDFWQADGDGRYDVQIGNAACEGWRLRGRLRTASDGTFQLVTIRPSPYPVTGGIRPAHIHVIVRADGHRDLVTELFFEGDPHLSTDPARLVRPGLVRPVTREAGVLRMEYEFVLER